MATFDYGWLFMVIFSGWDDHIDVLPFASVQVHWDTRLEYPQGIIFWPYYMDSAILNGKIVKEYTIFEEKKCFANRS